MTHKDSAIMSFRSISTYKYKYINQLEPIPPTKHNALFLVSNLIAKTSCLQVCPSRESTDRQQYIETVTNRQR